MAKNNWSGLTEQNDMIWERWFAKYVPDMGMAPSTGGEILRAMTRIIYRFYNDGDMAGTGYGHETCSPSDRYLERMVPSYNTLRCGLMEKEYESLMLKNHRTVFRYLLNNKDLFTAENTFDSRDVTEEDYRLEQEEWDDSLEDEWEED